MNFDNNTPAQEVIRFINGTNRSVFLTGKAGTGKTTLLKEIVEHTHKSVVIVAPTGIAALNAGGVTIHSMFQIPPACYVPLLDIEGTELSFKVMPFKKIPKEVSKMSGYKRNILRKMELLVIDEVSMLRADLLDAVDIALRSIRHERSLPFGGVQVLFIGDMLQLPPVYRNEEWSILRQYYRSLYFFDALVFNNEPPLILELEKIYRQDDKRFIEILNNLRNNQFILNDINELNRHYIKDFVAPKKQPYIFITTHNKKADAINDEKLRKLKGQSILYSASIQGSFPENIYPLPPEMELKRGAQIMFIKNDTHGGSEYYNGKIGEIHTLKDDEIQVIFPDTGKIVTVEPYQWENIRYNIDKDTGLITEEILGTFLSYPIKLAWAVTVHKSQGLTFQRAVIDISEAFAPGQVYVALSRLESLNGLVLSEPIVDDFPEQDRRVLNFTENKVAKDELDSIYSNENKTYVEQVLIESYNFTTITEELDNFLADIHDKSIGSRFKEQLNTIKKKMDELVTIGAKFQRQLSSMTKSYQLEEIKERITASITYFQPRFEELSLDLYVLIAEGLNREGTIGFINDLKNIELGVFMTQTKIQKCEKLLLSILTGGTLSKETLSVSSDSDDRCKNLLAEAYKKVPLRSIQKYSTKDYDTKDITLMLYNDGLSIDEIAEERDLTRKTIINHIRYHIAEGNVDVHDFVDKNLCEQIEETSKKLHTKSAAEIRANVPQASYDEIFFVLAAMEWQ